MLDYGAAVSQIRLGVMIIRIEKKLILQIDSAICFADLQKARKKMNGKNEVVLLSYQFVTF